MVFFYPAVSSPSKGAFIGSVAYLGTIEEARIQELPVVLGGLGQKAYLRSIVSSRLMKEERHKDLPIELYISFLASSMAVGSSSQLASVKAPIGTVRPIISSFSSRHLPNGAPIAIEPLAFPLNTYIFLKEIRKTRGEIRQLASHLDRLP